MMYYFQRHAVASEYGWTYEYIDTMPVDDLLIAVAIIQGKNRAEEKKAKKMERETKRR